MTVSRKQSFKTRLLVSLMLPTALSVFLVIGVVTYRQHLNLHTERSEKLEALAEVIGSNCTAALVFENTADADEVLSALNNVPGIVSACLYRPDETLFTILDNGKNEVGKTAVGEVKLDDGLTYYTRPILMEGEILGYVQLVYDPALDHMKIRKQVQVTAIIGSVALAVAFLLALGLIHSLIKPLVSLGKAVEAVTETDDYTIRAKKYLDDEFGTLTDGFNEMLDRIRQRDLSLKENQELLEHRVEERTKELNVAKEQAEASAASLKESEEQYRGIFESSSEGILIFTGEGEIVEANPRMRFMFGHDEKSSLSTDFDDFQAPESRNCYRKMLEVLKSSGAWQGELKLISGTGGQMHVEVGCTRFPSKEYLLYLAVIRDVTERVKAEMEKEKLQKQLVNASRLTGMAEIASSVLHNVGNVLNSLNISAGLVVNTLEASKLQFLKRATDMIKAQGEDPSDFLVNDEKGRAVVKYISGVADHLEAEHREMRQELKRLTSNIEHIKQIVATQQGYARSAGVREKTSLRELIDDALHMVKEKLDRSGIQLSVDISEPNDVVTDRHKILQVLVNLLNNAANSVIEAGVREPKVKVETSITVDKKAKVVVSDNGMGIAQENLTKIFQHGFTTRKEGHGFGLHGSALAVKALDGELKAESEGIGKGAGFILIFPSEPDKKGSR